MPDEIWKPIPECRGNYEVSNHGNIRNVRKGTMLIPRPTAKRYLRVHLHGKDFYIHRLVAEAFCEHPEGNNVVNHLDNNNQNNHADNLEWTTQFGNVHHGMKQHRYRLNAVPIIGYKDGKQYGFISAHQAEQVTGCDHSTIIKCCKGKKKTTHGFQWRYAEVG